MIISWSLVSSPGSFAVELLGQGLLLEGVELGLRDRAAVEQLLALLDLG